MNSASSWGCSRARVGGTLKPRVQLAVLSDNSITVSLRLPLIDSYPPPTAVRLTELSEVQQLESSLEELQAKLDHCEAAQLR